jgi:hypothetical protein
MMKCFKNCLFSFPITLNFKIIYFKETELHKFIMLNDDTKCKIQTEEEKKEENYAYVLRLTDRRKKK